MKWYKSTALLASVVFALVLGLAVSMGWIASIVFGVISITLAATPWGGNIVDLFYGVVNVYLKGRTIDNKEEKENIDMVEKQDLESLGTVAVMLSGGVDSAVTAHLLKEQGYKVKGFFMRNWNPRYAKEMKHVADLMRAAGLEVGDSPFDKEGNKLTKCQATIDFEWAQKVAKYLDIELVEIDFVKEYWDKVFAVFLEGLNEGITPNPDILCNSKVKFGEFYDYIRKEHSDMEYIATGHYAAIKYKNGKHYMAEAYDDWKDQTYFLAEVDRKILPEIMFPLGDLPKNEVRRIAKKINLPNFDRPDSMGICFIGKRNFETFLTNYIEEKPGDIVDWDTKEVVGRHKNSIYYTLGQRRGLNMGGSKRPYYVVEKDVEKNIVYAAMGSEHPMLNKDYLSAKDVKLLVDESELPTKNLEIKTRHSNIKHPATITNIEVQSDGLLTLDIQIEETVFGITPGQELVMYKDGICLGGGKIQ